jgi:recombination protein RecA
MIVVDSVAALVPKAEIEGEMGDSHVGLQARLMSQALRKLTANVHRSNVSLFFINQIRMKIGVMFGSPETTTGGNALKFYASMRLDIRRVGAIKVGEQSVGNRTRVKIVKNKLAPPFTECEFDVLFGEGISKSGDIIDLAVADNILEKSGAWISYGGERVGQGRENARNYLLERPKLLAELEAKILLKHGLTRVPGKNDAPAPSEKSEKSAVSAAPVEGSAKPANANPPANTTNASSATNATKSSDDDAKRAPTATNATNATKPNDEDAKRATKANDEDAKRAAAAAAARPRPRA